MEEIILNIGKDFNRILGPRYIKLGKYSGELFYKELLKNKFDEAVNSKRKLVVELDGAMPYGSSFIDESFGKLAREYGSDKVEKTIEIKTSIYPLISERIMTNIKKAGNEKM